MRFFASRYVKKLLNNFITLDADMLQTVNRNDLEKNMLDAIEELNVLLSDQQKVQNFEEALKITDMQDSSGKVRLCDIIIRLSGALPLENKNTTYTGLLSVWMQTDDIDQATRKKAYRALESMVKSDQEFARQN